MIQYEFVAIEDGPPDVLQRRDPSLRQIALRVVFESSYCSQTPGQCEQIGPIFFRGVCETSVSIRNKCGEMTQQNNRRAERRTSSRLACATTRGDCQRFPEMPLFSVPDRLFSAGWNHNSNLSRHFGILPLPRVPTPQCSLRRRPGNHSTGCRDPASAPTEHPLCKWRADRLWLENQETDTRKETRHTPIGCRRGGAGGRPRMGRSRRGATTVGPEGRSRGEVRAVTKPQRPIKILPRFPEFSRIGVCLILCSYFVMFLFVS